MKITILYDNEVYEKSKNKGLKGKWGFSCYIEIEEYNILFDTGGNSIIQLGNMEKLNIKPDKINNVFISHSHWDHIGALNEILLLNNKATIYSPFQFAKKADLPVHYNEILKKISINNNIKIIKEAGIIRKNVYTTGIINNKEQSLIIKTKKGYVIIVGCSHPGIDKILETAAGFGKVYALIGGFHSFNDFKLLDNIDLICPTHCTEYKRKIKSLYPGKCIDGGVGKVIEIL